VQALEIKPRRAAVVKKEEDVSAEQLQRDNVASYRDGGLFGKHGTLPYLHTQKMLTNPLVRG